MKHISWHGWRVLWSLRCYAPTIHWNKQRKTKNNNPCLLSPKWNMTSTWNTKSYCLPSVHNNRCQVSDTIEGYCHFHSRKVSSRHGDNTLWPTLDWMFPDSTHPKNVKYDNGMKRKPYLPTYVLLAWSKTRPNPLFQPSGKNRPDTNSHPSSICRKILQPYNWTCLSYNKKSLWTYRISLYLQTYDIFIRTATAVLTNFVYGRWGE